MFTGHKLQGRHGVQSVRKPGDTQHCSCFQSSLTPTSRERTVQGICGHCNVNNTENKLELFRDEMTPEGRERSLGETELEPGSEGIMEKEARIPK